MALQLDHLVDGIGFRFSGDQAIQSVAGAGDVNGDGFDDVIFGSPEADASGRHYAGESYVVFGTADGISSGLSVGALDGKNGFRLEGAGINDASGKSVAGAGDLNGDGFADLVVGAPYAGAHSPGQYDRHYAGAVYVVFGGCEFGASVDLRHLGGADGFRLDGAVPDGVGKSVAGAGDINGDGLPDLAIGVPNKIIQDAAYAGAAYVVFGSRTPFAPHLDLASLDGSDGFRLDGANANDLAGWSVASARDFNGDGIDDLVIGAPNYRGNDGSPGAAYVVFGTTTGFDPALSLASLSGVDGFRIDGLPYDALGRSLAGAGDLNGDGYDDLVIGAPYADPDGRDGAGATYVVFGSSSGFGPSLDVGLLDGTNGFRIDGPPNFGSSGSSVSGAGDVNGDGFADVLVGAPDASATSFGAGEAYLIFGSASGFAATPDLASLAGAEGIRIAPASTDYGIGGTVAAAGDVNGDGLDDIAVGTRVLGSHDAYVIFGSAAMGGPNDSPMAAADALSVDTSAVFDLTDDHGAGVDFDADFDDLAITAINGAPVVIGDQLTLASGLRLTLIDATDVRIDAPGLDLGATFHDQFSYQISDPAGATSAAIVAIDYAKSAIDLGELDGSTGFRLHGGGFEYSGSSVASAGDFNGDGIGDVIIGAADLGHDEGAAYVVFGSTAGFPQDVSLPDLDGSDGFRLTTAYGAVGYSVAGVGDINGDGFDDVAIAAPGGFYSDTPGAAYVVFGAATGFPPDLAAMDGSDGFRMDQITNHYGSISVSGAGDVNGDGIDDLLVGAASYVTDYAGETFVVFGSQGGFPANLDLANLDAGDGFRIDGVDPGDESGTAVSAAGDVNGDGFADFAIGAPGAAPDGKDTAGTSYVVFGTDAGFPDGVDLADLDGTDGFQVDGVDAGDASGGAIAGAGDVNGDGIDDLIIGAPRTGYVYENGSPGASYVLFGSACGFAPGVDLSALDGTNGFRIGSVGSSDWSGSAVSGAGDVNGDGFDDLLVGAPAANPGGENDYAGEAYVLFGSADPFSPSVDPALLDGQRGYRLQGEIPGGETGRSVAAAGDVNGDGIDDLIVGAPRNFYGDEDGTSYIVYGTRSGPDCSSATDIAALSGDAAHQHAPAYGALATADPDVVGARASLPPAASDGAEPSAAEGAMPHDHFAWM